MSLRLKLLGAFAYVLVLVLVAVEVPLALNVAKRVDTEVRAQASGAAHLIAASASGRLDQAVELDRQVVRAARDLGARVIVVDRSGLLMADSAGSGLLGDSYADRPEIRIALDEGRVAQGRRSSETLASDVLYTAVPVIEAGRRVGAVRVTQSVAAITAKVHRDVLALAGIGALALAAGLAIAWLLAGSLVRPLRALSRAAGQVADGDLRARADVIGSREQQEVAVAFNDMTARLGRMLDAQRQFVANASHQLRTPLTGLRLRLEAATLKASDQALRAELEAAEREAERLARLLRGLLTLAREGERPALREPVVLGSAAEGAVERWQASAERSGHRLELAGLQPVAALASAEDVAIILDNLIENALHYAPPGTVVTLEWGAAGRAAVLAVVDSGPGLAAGEEELVFERFARGTAAASAPGTGLGLAIVRALARRWGGDARIANRPTGGARVEVHLPLAALPTPNPTLVEA